MGELFERPLNQLLQDLGAARPTPGCGAAAALVAASGLALVRKALAVSAARAPEPRLVALLERADHLLPAFADYAMADQAAFQRLVKAQADTLEQDAARRQACAVPLASAHQCLQALDIAQHGWPLCAAVVRSDLLAGARLLHAALLAALTAVDADLVDLPPAEQQQVRASRAHLARRARQQLRHLMKRARQR